MALPWQQDDILALGGRATQIRVALAAAWLCDPQLCVNPNFPCDLWWQHKAQTSMKTPAVVALWGVWKSPLPQGAMQATQMGMTPVAA